MALSPAAKKYVEALAKAQRVINDVGQATGDEFVVDGYDVESYEVWGARRLSPGSVFGGCVWIRGRFFTAAFIIRIEQ